MTSLKPLRRPDLALTPLCPLQWPQASHFPSLGLSFLIYTIEALSTWKVGGEG